MRIYLSAVETNEEHSRAIRDSRAQSVLTSYHYVRALDPKNKRYKIWSQAMAQASAKLIDSGAYSWQQQARKGHVAEDHNKFFADYIPWLKRTREEGLADYWIELDIGMVVGAPWVHWQRQQWLRHGLGAGLIHVWHSMEHSWKDWEDMIAEAQRPGRSNYVAIEGNRLERDPLDYDKFLAYAYKKGCRVHGFRLTSIEGNLKRYPFYSVDSTTWMTGVTFGSYLGMGKDGWLSLSKHSQPLWGSGKAPRRAGPMERLDFLTRSAKHWVELEKQVTEYWERKGIKWSS